MCSRPGIILALAIVVAVTACGDGTSADDILSSEAMPEADIDLQEIDDVGEAIDTFVEERVPGEGASARAAAWTELANDYVRQSRSGGESDLVEQTVFAGIDLFPAGMPVPDLSYLGTAGVNPTKPGCVSNFQIDVGMYRLDAQSIPRPYPFPEAVTLMETGFSAAGWQILDAVEMYPDGHPMDSNAQGTEYLVDADGEHWRVWIHTYLSAASALYCPVS